MKKIFLIITSFLVCYAGHTQTSEDSVKMVINKMFASMKLSDDKELMQYFTDSAILQTIVKNKEGKVSVKNEEVAGFAKQVSSLPKDAADERITFEMIKLDDDLATAWTPYQFYFKGTFSHCGVDSYQLVRINGAWKIQYLIDTRRKDKCQ